MFDSKDGGIAAIKFEPTQMVFVANKAGKFRAMNIIKQNHTYIYLDLGKQEYATVALNKLSQKDNSQLETN